MKTEHPLLFSPEMINALLKGEKTVTRRIVKFKRWRESPVVAVTEHFEPFTDSPKNYKCWTADHYYAGKTYAETEILCPYGQIGDYIWSRETWKYSGWTEDGEPWIQYAADGDELLHSENIPFEWGERLTDIWADLSSEENIKRAGGPVDHKWRPSIFMPRWASRITLKITDVRMERLQDITEEDAIKEGMQSPGIPAAVTNVSAFAHLWNTINPKKNWESNPWVWVIDFERVKS